MKPIKWKIIRPIVTDKGQINLDVQPFYDDEYIFSLLYRISDTNKDDIEA